MAINISHEQQATVFLNLLQGRKKAIEVDSALYKAILAWLALPLEFGNDVKDQVVKSLCDSTGLTKEQITQQVSSSLLVTASVPENGELTHGQAMRLKMQEAQMREDELDALLPKRGFFERYATYTRESEAPLSYHVFCALAGLAATVNRRVFLDMGNHRLFPPFGVFILGNSGIKKTSAGDIIVSLLRESALTPIYAEKLTPEALIDGMRGGNATGLVYAPEMTVLISKQKYMESIIPLLTRFMDSPDIWNSGTIMRGKAELHDVGITCVMCSTLDWFTKNTPEALFGGGFIARNIMVLEEYSCRIKPRPAKEDLALRGKILLDLATAHELQGEVILSTEAGKAHDDWYRWNKLENDAPNELFETYYARKPSHLLRIAILLHIGTCGDLIVCHECWLRAKKLLTWVEGNFDLLGGKMFRSQYGEEQDLVLRAVNKAGGTIEWSKLMRQLSYRLSGAQLRVIVGGLKEQGRLEEIKTTVAHLIRMKEHQ